MTPLQTHIVTYIALKPCKRAKLLQYLLSQGCQITDRAMRKEVELMVKEGFLIGSSHSRGYFIVKDESDLNTAMKDYKSKVKGILSRAGFLYKNFYKTKNLEPELLFK